MQSHFFTMGQSEVTEYYQSEEEEDYGVDVLAAEHQPRLINKTWKETFDGVLMPSYKGKENVRPPAAAACPTPAGRPGIGTRANPSKPENPPSPNKPSRAPEEFISTPMDVCEPRKLIVTDNDVVMNEAQPSRQEPPQDKATVAKPQAPLRQSQVSSQVGDTQVVNAILNTPVTI
jgi:hypothetical protein